MGDAATTATKRGGNTKPPAQCRKWCLTWNNYTEDDFQSLESWLRQKNCQFVIGREVGECGTPHIQGFFELKSAIRFDTLKKTFPSVHWEASRGNVKQNLAYCSKEGQAVTNIELPKTAEDEYNEYVEKLYADVKWKPWQQEIVDMLESPADDRTVYWYWEPTGNVGKSFLVKYLDWKYNAIIANGKQQDVFNQYKMYLEEEKKQPKVAMIDIPRSHESYVCYSTFEKIKDGLFYSGKYDGGKLRLIPHHLVCFANFSPNTGQLSADRWVIRNIEC